MTLGTVTAGLALLVSFGLFELRSTHPMVDLRVFANARFSAASFAVTMIFLALFGWLFLFTQQLQFVLGYSALAAGVRCLPFALTMGVASAQSAKVAARIGTKAVVTAGLALMAIGFGVLSTATVHDGYPLLVVASMVVAAGMGLAMAPATESIMGSLPRAQAGVGSAVNDTTRFVGGALGVALTGSIASSVFASHLRPVLTHVPARDVAEAKSSSAAPLPSDSMLRGLSGRPSPTSPARRSWPVRTGPCSSPSWPPPLVRWWPPGSCRPGRQRLPLSR